MGKRLQKEEMNSLTSKVDEEFAKFLKEGKYKEVLCSLSNLGHYSFNNQLYILSQKIDARTLYTFRKWLSLGRSVKKGEKSIKIFRPIKGKKDESDDNAFKCRGFGIEHVFDISQTDGEEYDVFSFDEGKVVSNKTEILKALSTVANKIEYNVSYASSEELGNDCYGYCDHKNKKIKILENLSDLQEISTTIHECGHALAHSSFRSDFEGLTIEEKREIKEVEAESIACLVCYYLGLDTQNFNFSYIAAWSEGDIRKFRKNLEVVSKHSIAIIDEIDNTLNLKKEPSFIS